MKKLMKNRWVVSGLEGAIVGAFGGYAAVSHMDHPVLAYWPATIVAFAVLNMAREAIWGPKAAT